jgi:beta-galactosidase
MAHGSPPRSTPPTPFSTAPTCSRSEWAASPTTYLDLVDAHPRVLGGFVWEWTDHGIATRTSDRTAFFGYDGDFDEEQHDGTFFIVDWLLLPDRTPCPGLVGLAAVYAPVQVRAVPDRPCELRIRSGEGALPAGGATPRDVADGGAVGDVGATERSRPLRSR